MAILKIDCFEYLVFVFTILSFKDNVENLFSFELLVAFEFA